MYGLVDAPKIDPQKSISQPKEELKRASGQQTKTISPKPASSEENSAAELKKDFLKSQSEKEGPSRGKASTSNASAEKSNETPPSKEISQPRPNPSATPLAARLEKFKNTEPFSEKEKSKPKQKVEEEPIYSPPKTPLAARLDRFKKTKAFDEVKRPRSKPQGIFEKNAEASAVARRASESPVAARWESFKGMSAFKNNDFKPQPSNQERGVWGATGRTLVEYQVGRGAEQFDEGPPEPKVPESESAPVEQAQTSRFRIANAKKRGDRKAASATKGASDKEKAALGEFTPFKTEKKSATAQKLGNDSDLASTPTPKKSSKPDSTRTISPPTSKTATVKQNKIDSAKSPSKKSTLISFPSAGSKSKVKNSGRAVEAPKIGTVRDMKKEVEIASAKLKSEKGKNRVRPDMDKAVEEAAKNLPKKVSSSAKTRKAKAKAKAQAETKNDILGDLFQKDKQMDFADGIFENVFGSKKEKK